MSVEIFSLESQSRFNTLDIDCFAGLVMVTFGTYWFEIASRKGVC